MFEYLKGTIEYKKGDYVALDVNNIGYKVNISLRTYDEVKKGDIVKFYIYNYIKEDSYKLIGFLHERDRKAFELLLGVKGIGMSLALSVMSTFDADTLGTIIASGDYKTLKRVPKLGEKKAQQVILDLKGKFKKLGNLFDQDNEIVNIFAIEDELYEALESLGYSKKEIESLVSKEEIMSFKTLEEAIKTVLRKVKY
ncbi:MULTISPECIES: Holliday junction branch migration protein RuvA [Fusobacterium]|jgi:Holliday junction DNA helicase RuvA|uniref:Holliday junction branch migration complex subunit RuvA n=1 Tax=Fusobacterium hominis TaxID=2764326 RepID=A0A7G9GXS6_9FUSO|nr:MULTISPECIES: Holliday junction branch migration protein RuvA [Fusobacterium]QNM15608.1 Holliday junction branch migration protein RuvA [Fusobacterium hominis]